MAIKITYTCDLCKEDVDAIYKIPVLFWTDLDDNEGRSMPPKIGFHTKEVCEDCIRKLANVKIDECMGGYRAIEFAPCPEDATLFSSVKNQHQVKI